MSLTRLFGTLILILSGTFAAVAVANPYYSAGPMAYDRTAAPMPPVKPMVVPAPPGPWISSPVSTNRPMPTNIPGPAMMRPPAQYFSRGYNMPPQAYRPYPMGR